ncbi:hypothetical protein D9M73_146180 [compost metagenome]
MRVCFVGLDAIGEPHGDEVDLQALAAQLLGGQLAQPAGHRGINAAAGTEHQGLRCGGSKILCDKGSATGDFSSRVEMARHPQFGGDADLFNCGSHADAYLFTYG